MNLKKFEEASPDEINRAMILANRGAKIYKHFSLKIRADFMRKIAALLKENMEELIEIAGLETHLPPERLQSELQRTIFQLLSYADACEKGNWMNISIDKENNDSQPLKQTIRKMMAPLGPVVVFGASNFPFAYSTAGGDTACAFAAGCSVIVKAHPAHSNTSQKVADLVLNAVKNANLPAGIFTHIHGASTEIGKQLVQHEYTKAVGFTGSTSGGRQLFDWGNQRNIPIPVFAEMGSVNPVFLLPAKLRDDHEEIASIYAPSITLSVGQFCTNPGLIIGIRGEALDKFCLSLGKKVNDIAPALMLHPGIAKAFYEKRNDALAQKGVDMISEATLTPKENEGMPTIATVSGKDFLANPKLHQEVFGPYALVIQCENMEEMLSIATGMGGQLTSTIMAHESDIKNYPEIVEVIKDFCGRLIFNGVPTGVEVCLSMQHGGPYPATTDSRFTAVGADGIRRFSRPIAFQNWPDSLLPDELKDDNPLGLWRTINNEMTSPDTR